MGPIRLTECPSFVTQLGAMAVWASVASAVCGQTAEELAKRANQVTQRLTDHTYVLQYKQQPGAILRYRVDHQVAVKTTIDGSTQQSQSRSRSVKRWRVTRANSESIELVHEIESVDMWSETKGRPAVQYNSQTDKEVPPQYEGVAEMIGKPLATVVMDRAGQIRKRDQSTPPTDLGAGGLTIPLPDRPVKLGEEWSAPSSVRVRLSDGEFKTMNTRQLFRLEKVASGVATISIKTQVLTPVPDPRVQSQLVQKLTNGEIKFDLDAGCVISKQLDWDEDIVGFSGAASQMIYLARLTEELLLEKQAAAPSVPRR